MQWNKCPLRRVDIYFIKFTPEQSKRKNPFCDHFAEASCELSVRNYFDIRDDKKNPYYIDGDDEIYRLLTEGIPALSEKMEIYTTDRFSRKAVIRPAVRPALVYDNYTGKSAKLEQCVELVESCVNSGHKLLLFSQFTSMLDIVAARLDGMGIRYFMLTGSTKPAQRLKMVNSFNGDDTSVFLISLKAGGTGLNLTGADVVIHYDPWWNSSAENQASDRAYRIGQKKNVQIYKLITRNTILPRRISSSVKRWRALFQRRPLSPIRFDMRYPRR